MATLSKILTRLPLAEANVPLDPLLHDELVKELLGALKVDIPILNFLEASEVVTADEVHENRLWLTVMMVEASQIYLDCSAAKNGRPPGRQFAEEVAEAVKQMGNVEWRTREAAGEGRSPLDDIQDGPYVSSTRAVRDRLRRYTKAGRVYLPAFPYSRQFDIGPTPTLLPRGPIVKIRAGIKRLEKLQATLIRISFVGDDAKVVAEIPGVFKCKKLIRNLDRNHLDWGAVMQRAMDDESLLEMEVSISLDWVTAAAMSFQLRSLLEPDR